MEENKNIVITDEEGNVYEYTVIGIFGWKKTNKEYIIYTDNTKDENGKLNVMASIYNENDLTKLEDIETDEEWDFIDKILKMIMGEI